MITSHVHQVAHDAVAEEKAVAGEAQAVSVEGEQMAVEVGLGGGEQMLAVGGAEAAGDVVDAETLAGAQGGHDEVVETVGDGEHFALLQRALALLYGLDVTFHIADVPRAGVHVVAVSGGTKAHVGCPLPVAAVVAAVVARPCKIADFVVLVAGRLEAVDELVVHGKR